MNVKTTKELLSTKEMFSCILKAIKTKKQTFTCQYANNNVSKCLLQYSNFFFCSLPNIMLVIYYFVKYNSFFFTITGFFYYLFKLNQTNRKVNL